MAAGVVGADASLRALLSAIAETARQIFGASASTIMLLDEEANELVVEAVAGQGEELGCGSRQERASPAG